jgi:hypothetical protein
MNGTRYTGQYCNICGKELTSWDLRCSKSLAYKNPVCEPHIAKEYDKTVDEFREVMEEYYGERPCQGI